MSGFYHIWAWRPSWSCDLDIAIKRLSPLPMDAQHKISLCLTKQFQRRRSLKSVYGQQTGQGQEMTLTYINHIPSSTPLVICIYHFSGLRLQQFSKKSIVFTFSYVKAYVSKFDLAVKLVKVIHGSSFYQTMMI